MAIKEPWREAWRAALAEWQLALAAFQEAEEPFIDLHASRLRAAEEKLSLILRLVREHPEPVPPSFQPKSSGRRRRPS